MIYNYSIEIDTANGLFSAGTLHWQIQALGLTSLLYVSSHGDLISVEFSTELSIEQKQTLDTAVSNHTGLTIVEQLTKYMDSQVIPFTKELIYSFAAENISMGITQAGKTGHVLALFSKKYPVPNNDFQNSLKSSLDTGSLYVSRDILQYIRDNSSEFSGLSPFITDARLLAMKNKIETFLGIPLST